MTFEHGMIIRVEYPPIIAEIDAAFHTMGKPIIYAFGDVIYNPAGVPISRPLVLHEATHGTRQIAMEGGVEAWWKRYIADPEFRLNEEIPAHQNEYKMFRDLNHDRNLRAIYLQKVARKLASPLYGSLITFKDAKALVEKMR